MTTPVDAFEQALDLRERVAKGPMLPGSADLSAARISLLKGLKAAYPDVPAAKVQEAANAALELAAKQLSKAQGNGNSYWYPQR